MRDVKIKKGQSKTFWTLRFVKDDCIDIGDCHGDGALHLWKTKKGAIKESWCFEEKALPTRIKITRIA